MKSTSPCIPFLIATIALIELAAASQDSTAASLRKRVKLKEFDSYSGEAIAIVAITIIILNIVYGRRKNNRLAKEYAAQLLRSDGAIQRQFASAEPELLQDGPSLYKLYCTGRRYVQGALLTLRLARRQDLLAVVMHSDQRDFLDIEVAMNESPNLVQSVLFIGTHAAARVIPAESYDISQLAKRMDVSRGRLSWPTQLVVYAEHASVFYEVFDQPVMNAMFHQTEFGQVAKLFRYIHISSDYRPPSTYQQRLQGAELQRARPVVRMSLYLPAADDFETLDKFINVLGMVIDGFAAAKLSAEQGKKAAEARRRADEARPEIVQAREARLEARRLEKEAQEKERLSKLPADQREKERAKKEKKARERKLRALTKRV